MSIVAPGQTHFDGGEISPLLQGRIDSDRLKSALALCKNWIPTLQGALGRRPGTHYLGQVKTASLYTRLIPFEYSTTQSYALEFGNLYIRFWANYGQVTSGGTPIEVVTPYTTAQLPQLSFTQSADVIYITHPSHRPRKLMRISATSWQLVIIPFIDGPYLPIPSGYLGMTAGATSGSTTLQTLSLQNITTCTNNGAGLIRVQIPGSLPPSLLTFLTNNQQVYITGVVGTTEANGTWRVNIIDSSHFDLVGSTFVHAYVSGGTVWDATFSTGDVGRLIRLQSGTSAWNYATITAFTNPTLVTITINGILASTTTGAPYMMGAWSTTTGYPSRVTFHQDRLVFDGPPAFPQRVDASMSGNYETFSPSQLSDGSVLASNALSFSLNANDVNACAWLSSDERALLVGSVSAEWSLRASTALAALTPTNVNAGRTTRWGSSKMPAIQVGKATMFVQRGGRKLRELHYYFDVDSYRATDLTELAEHITGDGVTDIAFQGVPNPLLWLVREDGALITMTYDRDSAQLRAGWSWHVLGGASDAAGTPAVVESICAIPDPTGVRDDLWMIVKRFVNGATVRYVEYLTKVFEDVDDEKEAFFVDCGNTIDNPITLSLLSAQLPVSVRATSHGLSTADFIRIDDVTGLNITNADGSVTNLVNGGWFKIVRTDANNFTLQDVNGNDIDGRGYSPGYDGVARKLFQTVTGLTYLENETVSILADGAPLPDQVVSNTGTLTLPLKAAVVTVGYSYNSDGQLLRTEAGSRNGVALGKTRRMHRVGLMLHRSSGLKIGTSFDTLDPVLFRTQGVDHNTRAGSLFTGIHSHEVDFDYDFDNQLCFRVSQPVPCLIQAILPQLEVQDRQ